MFQNKSLFVILNEGGTEKIERVELTKETQTEVCLLFGNAYHNLLNEKTQLDFSGAYKPDKDELQVIKGFQMKDNILEAIRNPIGVPAFQLSPGVFPDMKALFVGNQSAMTEKVDSFTIAFQKFRKDQYINRIGLNLYYDKNTFERDKRYGISIHDTVDCIYTDSNLIFNSFYFTRQIFDLSNHYRIATDHDVDAFINHDKVLIENNDAFKAQADSWVRRKIALIDDSGIFDKYPVKKISEKAKNIGIELVVKQKKIQLPSDKKELKNILKFLDDEIYKGTFSEEILQTNSKKKAEI